MSAREITVTVTLRWEGDRLMMAGGLVFGRVSELPILDAHRWATFTDFGKECTFHPTREAAMEAVEKAVVEAMGGE